MARFATLVLAAAILAVAAAPAAAAARAPIVRDTQIQDAVEEFRRERQAQVAAAAPDPLNCTMTALLFDQRVDHFSPLDTRTWKQRWYVCDGMYARGSRQPVYMYLGGEGPLDGPFKSMWMDAAREQGGLLVFAEHRYYGKSMPFGRNASLTNGGLWFLTAEQALADFAAITVAVETQYQVPRGAFTLAYGGSYAGSLATYARQLYPHLYNGAHASSSVVKMVLPTRAYEAIKPDSYSAMSASLRDAGGETCALYAKAAFEGLQFLQGSVAGRLQLGAAVGMCDPAALNTTAAVDAIAQQFRDTWWSIFQTAFKQVNPDNALAKACASIPLFPATPLGAAQWMGNVTRTLYFDGARCFDSTAAVLPFSDQDPRPTEDWAIAYIYQNCRQGFALSTYFWSQPPASLYGTWQFRLPTLDRWCRHIYGLQRPLAPPRWLLYNPQLYARLGRIIFASSGYDPWRPGSVLHSLGPTVPAVFTPRASHCSELYAARNTTSAQVNATQAHIKAIVRRWVLERDWHGSHF